MKGEEMKYKDGSQIKVDECTKDSVYDTKVGGTRTGEGEGLGGVWVWRAEGSSSC